MSAFVGFCQQDRAYLWADGAVYSLDSVLRDVTRKCIRVAGVPIVVASRGPDFIGSAFAWFLQAYTIKPDDIRLVGPVVMNEFVSSISDQLEDRSEPTFDIGLMAWSKDLDRPFLALADWKPGRGFRISISFEDMVAPAPDDRDTQRLRREIGFPLPHALIDPDRFGMAVMRALRRRPQLLYDGTQAYVVGVHVQRVTMTRDGFRDDLVQVWPDEIGRLIDPFRGVVRASRAKTRA